MDMDEREDKSDTVRMFNLIREVGNTLVPGLKLTADLPEFHDSGKCPMLDLQVWIHSEGDHSRVRHSFYQNRVHLC